MRRWAWWRELPWLLALAVAALAVGPLHPWVERSAYGADRVAMSAVTQLEMAGGGWRSLAVGPALVFFRPGDRTQAEVVGRDAAWSLPRVARITGLRPPSRALVVVEGSEQAMQSALGWGAAEEALGVYWNGVV